MGTKCICCWQTRYLECQFVRRARVTYSYSSRWSSGKLEIAVEDRSLTQLFRFYPLKSEGVGFERDVACDLSVSEILSPNVKLSHPERVTVNYWLSTAGRRSAQPLGAKRIGVGCSALLAAHPFFL